MDHFDDLRDPNLRSKTKLVVVVVVVVVVVDAVQDRTAASYVRILTYDPDGKILTYDPDGNVLNVVVVVVVVVVISVVVVAVRITRQDPDVRSGR